MDDIIHLLPDSVANQIAAGEVVQRPSSIIKEMVENSIDAGAVHVQVFVTDGGKTSVQIIDDGKGMSETDARLAFERHATSKISKAADLFTLTTMGFRGEALASIAAVAQVELKTRRPEDELGTYIQISGSKIEGQEPVNCPVGSNFSVKNLFFNVPARRKFLKSNQTEFSNILADFERIALVNPDVAFTLHNNDNEVYDLPKASVRQRIVDVFGRKINAELLPVDAETSLVSISGYVGKPETARKKGARQFFFVNGRYMRHPYFHSAVMHAYENLIPAGEHVSYFIYLSVDPSTIDVNVHPTKTEIKFDNEQPIWQVLSAVVKEALGKFCDVPSIDFDVDGKPNIPVMGAGAAIPHQPKPITTTYNPFNTDASRFSVRSERWEELYEGLDGRRKGHADIPDADDAASTPTVAPSRIFDSPLFSQSAEARDMDEGPSEESAGSILRKDAPAESSSDVSIPHFQYKGRYIVTPVKSGLMIVDQRRAHVRVLFEKYMKNIASHKRVSQGVLFPEIVEFAKRELVTLESILEELEFIGFDLTNLGGGSYSINGVPSGIEGVDTVKLLRDLVTSAMEKGCGVKEKMCEAISLTMAESAAIVYGQVLSDVEAERLLHDLFLIPTSMRTPDGKLVFTVIENSAIEKNF